MPLINQTQIIHGVTSAIVSIHEHKISSVNVANFPQATEVLIDFRPIEFSEKHPPKPQLPANELLVVVEQKGKKKFGIILSGASDFLLFADDLAKILPSLDVIAIDFHGFRDGRGYSLAQAIRQLPNFSDKTTLRVMGDILPDTLELLAKVGFTEFAIDNPDFDESWFGWFESIKTPYDGRSAKQLPIFAKV